MSFGLVGVPVGCGTPHPGLPDPMQRSCPPLKVRPLRPCIAAKEVTRLTGPLPAKANPRRRIDAKSCTAPVNLAVTRSAGPRPLRSRMPALTVTRGCAASRWAHLGALAVLGVGLSLVLLPPPLRAESPPRATRASAPITLDGRLDEPDWQAAPVASRLPAARPRPGAAGDRADRAAAALRRPRALRRARASSTASPARIVAAALAARRARGGRHLHALPRPAPRPAHRRRPAGERRRRAARRRDLRRQLRGRHLGRGLGVGGDASTTAGWTRRDAGPLLAAALPDGRPATPGA